MSEELFDVVFFGILQTGKDKETVMQNMAALFKTDAKKLAPYFAGGRKVIKASINVSSAEKYKSALENVGLVVTLEACVSETKTAENNSVNDTQASNNADSGNSSISIAAVGADVLANPVGKPAQVIGDISGITMADAGVDVIENPTEKVAQKIGDISDLSMAEAGSNVLDKPREVVAQKIADISDISLADTGVDLIENPKPKETAPAVDISGLTLDS